MDNQILCYGVHTNFRLNRRKAFKGHNVSDTIYGVLVTIFMLCTFVVTIFRLPAIRAKLHSHPMRGISLFMSMFLK